MQSSTLVSGDQNVFWDALLKLVVLQSLGRRVAHSVHSPDFFSRGREVANATFSLSNEAYRRDGNVNRWTATMEAAPFLGAMAVAPQEFTSRHVNVGRLADYNKVSEDEAIEQLTVGDWLGVSGGIPNGVAEDTPIKDDLNKAFAGMRRQLFDDLRQSVIDFLPDEQKKEAERQFALLFCLKQFTHKTVGEAYRSILAQNANELALLGPISSTLEPFLLSYGRPCSRLFTLFVDYEGSARAAYNEAIQGEGEALRPLEHGDLPFYAIVRSAVDGRMRRIDLRKARSSSVTDILDQAGRDGGGEVMAVLGKAVPFALDLRLQGPVVMPEGGSVYSPRTVQFARLFTAATKVDLPLQPVYRLRFHALDALADVTAKFRLPPYLAAAFGDEVITGQEFARRWRQAVEQATARAQALAGPIHGLMANKTAYEWFQAGALRDLFEAAASHKARYDAQLTALFARPAPDPSDKAARAAAGKVQGAAKARLEQEYEYEAFKGLGEYLLGLAEDRRAALLRPQLQVIKSLPYYNCRPFWHWVNTVPEWKQSIINRAELVRETDADLVRATVTPGVDA